MSDGGSEHEGGFGAIDIPVEVAASPWETIELLDANYTTAHTHPCYQDVIMRFFLNLLDGIEIHAHKPIPRCRFFFGGRWQQL